MSSVAFLLPSATACLPEGNILAVFPSEDVFGNLDECRERIVSFILIANTTRLIWLHSYFHLHVIIVEHQPALSSDSNRPTLVLHSMSCCLWFSYGVLASNDCTSIHRGFLSLHMLPGQQAEAAMHISRQHTGSTVHGQHSTRTAWG